jgi:hypothetical protein
VLLPGVFTARGYHAAAIQDIADAVGLLKGSLYPHVSWPRGDEAGEFRDDRTLFLTAFR